MTDLWDYNTNARHREAVEERMMRLETKEIGGDVLFFRGDNDCLTIHRSHMGTSVLSVEGEWTEEEQDAACRLYHKFGASQR